MFEKQLLAEKCIPTLVDAIGATIANTTFIRDGSGEFSALLVMTDGRWLCIESDTDMDVCTQTPDLQKLVDTGALDRGQLQRIEAERRVTAARREADAAFITQTKRRAEYAKLYAEFGGSHPDTLPLVDQ